MSIIFVYVALFLLLAAGIISNILANILERAFHENRWYRFLPRRIKVIIFAVSLLVLSIAALHLDPTNYLPVAQENQLEANENQQGSDSVTNPIEIFDVVFHPVYENYQYIPDVTKITLVENGIENGQPIYKQEFSNLIPASLVGEALLSFDVANMTKVAQVDIREIYVDIEREEVDLVHNIYMEPPGMGGAEIRDFNVRVDYSETGNETGEQSFLAQPSLEEDFDFLKLSPGEMEAVRLLVALPLHGLYTITPKLKIKYPGYSYDQEISSYQVFVPDKYRIWTHVQNQMLEPSEVIIDRVSASVHFEGDIKTLNIKPILFESTIANYWFSRIYIVEDGILHAPVQGETVPGLDLWMLRWIDEGQGIEYNYHTDDAQNASFAMDLSTNSIIVKGEPFEKTVPEVDTSISNVIHSMYGDYHEFLPSPDNNFIAFLIASKHKIAQEGINSVVVFYDISSHKSFVYQVPKEYCIQLSWSFNSDLLTFVCSESENQGSINKLDIETRTTVWTIDVEGNLVQVSLEADTYYDPIFSADGTQILVGGNALRIFDSHKQSIPQVIMKSNFGVFMNPSWRP